jgi:hypothetical protein
MIKQKKSGMKFHLLWEGEKTGVTAKHLKMDYQVDVVCRALMQ